MMAAFDEDAEEIIEEIDEQERKEDRRSFMEMLEKQDSESYLLAETNRDFIFSAFRHLRNGEIKNHNEFANSNLHDIQVYSDSIHKIPCARKGLYLIYQCWNGEKFPIYIGFTGTSFRKRLGTHMRTGVIRQFFTTHQGGTLKVDLVPTYFSMHSKLLESVFLTSFDFFLNNKENESNRQEMNYDANKTDQHISRMFFDNAYKIVVAEINAVHKYYLEWIE